MPKLDLGAVEQTRRTGYPPPFDREVAGRLYRKIGVTFGLQDFGVSEATLLSGAWSSHRHWHEGEDELVVMIEGEAVLVDEAGRSPMRAGDIAVFPKGVANGNHLINESNRPCRYVAVGRPSASDCHYPDVDLHLDGPSQCFGSKSEFSAG